MIHSHYSSSAGDENSLTYLCFKAYSAVSLDLGLMIKSLIKLKKISIPSDEIEAFFRGSCKILGYTFLFLYFNSLQNILSKR
jgi:hypothetical protein